MIAAVLLGAAPWSHRLLVAGAVVWPLPTLGLLAMLLFRARRQAADRPAMGEEAALLLDVLGSLQAGRTLRSSLTVVSPEVERLVRVGAPTDQLADGVAAALGEQGDVAGVAVRLIDRAGGPAAPVIAELAAQATETVRLRRELRAAIAAPILQGVVVGGAPLLALGWMIATGSFTTRLAASPAHAASVLVGASMTVAGAVWVASIVRKAAR